MSEQFAFRKYCSQCRETFGSNDIDEFLEMMSEHKCILEKG